MYHGGVRGPRPRERRDGSGRDSPFTSALLGGVETQGLEMETLFTTCTTT